MRRTLCHMLLVGWIVLASGCAAPSRSPYADAAPGVRDPALAARLAQEAAEVFDTSAERCEALLRQALAADLYHGPAHNNLGVLHLTRGHLYDAASEFEWARKLMPGHPDPRLNLALTLERAGRVDEAIATYETALEVYPDHVRTMQGLARCRLRYGRDDADLRAHLEEIALRGETRHWRTWARGRLVDALP